MLYVQLDVNWINNPKIIRAGVDGAGLHAIAMCLAKQLDTDGWIDLLVLNRHGATVELVQRLVDLRLLEREGDRVRPWGWHERNLSSAEIAAKKADDGRRGNHIRWHSGDYAECEKCHPPPTIADRSGTDSGAIGDVSGRSLEPESYPEVKPPQVSDLDRIVDEVFTRCLADKQRRGEAIHTVEGFRKWWDANESEGCRKRAAWFLEHYTMPTLGHYADATRSPTVPRWASSMLNEPEAV